MAITTNLLIQTGESGISISATDLETGFEGFYPASIEAQGVIAINARKLYEIVRDFPSEDIYVNEIENHWIEIGNQNVEYHIVGLNPEDFPEIPKIEEVEFFEIDSASFAKMIEETVIISGAPDDTRAHILVFMLRESSRRPKNIPTGSNRWQPAVQGRLYFRQRVDLPSGSNVLIPKKGLMEVAKFLDSEGRLNSVLKITILSSKEKKRP